MIQKITVLCNHSTRKIVTHSRQVTDLNNTLNKEYHTVSKHFKFAKIKRFFTELKREIKSMLRKDSNNNELKKSKKKSIVKYSEEEMERNRKINEEKRLVVKKRVEYNQKDIEKNGHKFERGDVDENGFPTTQGKEKLNNPAHKGRLDDLDLQNNIEKHLSNEDGIHIRDKFTDWQHGKNLDDMPQIIEDAGTNMHGIEFKTRDINSISGHIGDDVQHHTESSLLEALEKNQAKRNQIEQQADDILGHNHLDDIDDIPDSFFD